MSQFCFTFHHFGYSYPSINKTSIKYQFIVYNNQNGHVLYLLKMIKLYNE